MTDQPMSHEDRNQEATPPGARATRRVPLRATWRATSTRPRVPRRLSDPPTRKPMRFVPVPQTLWNATRPTSRRAFPSAARTRRWMRSGREPTPTSSDEGARAGAGHVIPASPVGSSHART